MLEKRDLQAIADIFDERLEVKLEEKLEAKLEEKLDVKLEEKLEAKLEEKLEEKLDPIRADIVWLKDKVELNHLQTEAYANVFLKKFSEQDEKIDRVLELHRPDAFDDLEARVGALEVAYKKLTAAS